MGMHVLHKLHDSHKMSVMVHKILSVSVSLIQNAALVYSVVL
jgi:hypothetical protein